MKKTTMIISAALTAFILLILSGVVYSVNQNSRAAAAESQTVSTVPGLALTEGSTGQEAAYQELIRQANQRLEQAQAEIQRLQSLGSNADISLEQAAQVAASYIGQTDIYSVENSAINGQSVYRITFSSGDVVLVSTVGQVLAVQPAAEIFSLSSSGSFQEDDEHDEQEEHEEFEHDEFEDED